MDNVLGLQHIGLPVANSDRTVAFYKALGFSVAYDTWNGEEHVVFLRKGDLVIETYQNGEATLRDGAWDHVALGVRDIRKAWDEVVVGLALPSLEGAIRFLPFWDHGVKFFTVLGPDNERIEFSQMLD